MLIITTNDGERQVTAAELAKEYNLPMEKFKASKLFNINPQFEVQDLGESDQQRRRVTRRPRGIQHPAEFTFKDSEGYDVTVRYCSTPPYTKMENGFQKRVFTPRNIRVEGEGSVFREMDLVVFLFMHPQNRQSPVRNRPYWSWEYDDKLAKAEAEIAEVDDLYEAMKHAKEIRGTELVLFAKGVGIEGAERLDAIEIRAKLLTLAKNNPKWYNEKRSKSTTMYEGQIQDCIDKGVFELQKIGGRSVWVWATGAYIGQEIVSLLENGVTANDTLKNFMKAKENIRKYYDEMIKLHDQVLIDLDADAYLDTMKKGGEKPVPKTKDGNKEVPSNFQEVKDYLTNLHPDGKTASNVRSSEFLKRIQAGEIDFENLESEGMNYIAKTE